MSPVPVFILIPGSHHLGTQLCLVRGEEGSGIQTPHLSCGSDRVWQPILNLYNYRWTVDIWLLLTQCDLSKFLLFVIFPCHNSIERAISVLFMPRLWHILCTKEGPLAHCGPVTPYSDIDLDQHSLRLWLFAWQHQAIIWTNVNVSSVI